jgi:thymidylate synthase (FAD)
MEAELIDSMGDDITVVNAARVSFAKEVEEFGEKDTRLIKYLARHNHWTPFAHVTATFRVTAPIFVARQLFKHVVGLVTNEVSRRYVSDEPQLFLPDEWRMKPVNAKQGSSGAHPYQEELTGLYMEAGQAALGVYNAMIEMGVAPEQARMILPQSMQTEWYWTGSLASFARVCKQRISDDAQAETRYIAEEISDQLSGVAPVSWEVLTDGGE